MGMAEVDKSLPGDQPLPLPEFYEEDEPVEKVEAAFEAGEKQLTAPPDDDGGYITATDFEDLTDEEKEILAHNAERAEDAFETLLNAVIEHREDCECPNLLCIGEKAIAMRGQLTRVQEHMVFSVALSWMARHVIAQNMNERYL
jgi:hypothetical protein